MRYLDASVLAKAYLPAAGSDQVRTWLAEGGCATARWTEVEVTSALARRWREGRGAPAGLASVRKELARDLESLVVVELAPEVVARAADLLVRRTLRAGDAIQLASALVLAEAVPEDVRFSCADARLAEVAVLEGLELERV